VSELRQRKPPLSDEKYLARIRELPCCVCGATGPSDAAHLRMASVGWGIWGDGKEATGGSVKPDDCYAVPLCRPRYKPDPVARMIKPDKPLKLVNVGCHGRQHGHDQKHVREVIADNPEALNLEEAFWRSTGKNPFMIASVLYEKFGSVLTPRKKRARPARQDKPPKPKRTGPKQKIANRGFDKTVKRTIPKRKK
jgi:hypothetical protein